MVNSNSEEVTEDEHGVLQEILEAHRKTFPQMEEAALSPVPSITNHCRTDSEGQDEEVCDADCILVYMLSGAN